MISRPKTALAAVFVFLAQTGSGAEAKLGEAALTVHGAITYGTSYRTASRDPALLWKFNAATLGLPPISSNGRNQDDGDLNYDRGDQVSSVVKALANAELKYHQVGALVRAKAWHDFALSDDRVPWGNIPDGFAANQPLSDRGFSSRAKFSGGALQEAYAHGDFAADGLPIYLRAGNQTIPWGDGVRIGGGLSVLNPVDLPALHRPGAMPEESRVPFPALLTRIGGPGPIKLEAFYQFRWRASARDGGGTFYSAEDATPEGSDKVFVFPGSDRDALVAGNYMKRRVTPPVANAGQFGLGLTWKADAIKTNFGLYAARYHSRAPIASALKTQRTAGPVFVAGDPDGMNPAYLAEYPEGIALYGATFSAKPALANFYGELTYSPNQPLQLNSVDLLNAVVTATGPTVLRAAIDATPFGGVLHGYDRFGVGQLKLGAGKNFQGILGAATLTVELEGGVKQVRHLPDQSVRRYGRSDAFGIGTVGGVGSGDDKQRSTDGFVSRLSYGYRLRSSLRYPRVRENLNMLPAVVFGHDVRGWSCDNVFNEGRMTHAVSLRIEYRKFYYLEIVSNGAVAGGAYNNARDRDVASVTAGLKL
jgi:hypothetical protein